MTSVVTPAEFCRAIMHDYERQWAEAMGHAQRHPLRVKIVRMEELLGRELTAEDFERLLAEAVTGDDWELSLLCADLEPRWRAALSGQKYLET